MPSERIMIRPNRVEPEGKIPDWSKESVATRLS
jgi:hypothetical protein